MAELGDALALGASGAIRGGSTPLPPTEIINICEGNSVEECVLAKHVVAGSSPVPRSSILELLV